MISATARSYNTTVGCCPVPAETLKINSCTHEDNAMTSNTLLYRKTGGTDHSYTCSIGILTKCMHLTDRHMDGQNLIPIPCLCKNCAIKVHSG